MDWGLIHPVIAATISATERKIILPYRTKPAVNISLYASMGVRYPTLVHRVSGSIQTSANATTVQVHVAVISNVQRVAFISSLMKSIVTNLLCASLGRFLITEIIYHCAGLFIGEINFRRFPIVLSCADGLYFDRELGQCNFPEYAECESEVCPPENDPKNITFIPSENYCDK